MKRESKKGSITFSHNNSKPYTHCQHRKKHALKYTLKHLLLTKKIQYREKWNKLRSQKTSKKNMTSKNLQAHSNFHPHKNKN